MRNNFLDAVQAKAGLPGVSPAEAQAALLPNSRAARRRVRREGGSSVVPGYHAPRHRTGRPVFEPTMAEKLRAHVQAGGCDVTTKKGGLCQIKPLKGTTTCKVHTGKKANADG